MDIIKLLNEGLVKAKAIPIDKSSSSANWDRLMKISNIKQALGTINFLIQQENENISNTSKG